MDNKEVKAIVSHFRKDPLDLVKHYLSKPEYLEDWLRSKKKTFVGVSIDCTDCVISNYLSQKLFDDGFETRLVESGMGQASIFLDDQDFDVVFPSWVYNFIQRIDHHRNPNLYIKRNKVTFTGNLAANILKATLEAME